MPTPKSTVDALSKLLNASGRPLYAIDEQRRIIFCNAALASWIDLDSKQIIGRRVEFHSEEPKTKELLEADSAPLTDLCPPPSALAGETIVGTISCATRDGRLRHRAAEFITLGRRQRRKTTGTSSESAYVSLLVVLGSADLTPQEVAAEVSGEPTVDELHRTIRRFRRGQAQRYSIQSLLGSSSAMQKVRAQVEVAVASAANVLICGPRGSGRSHVARAIHHHAAGDREISLLPVKCDSLTDDLWTRTLDRIRPVRAGGERPTLLIENLDAMSAEHQALLLKAIQQESVNTRIVATISAANSASVGERNDDASPVGRTSIDSKLRNWISTIEIQIPRLIDRLEDLPILTQYFLEACNRNNAKQVGALRRDALDLLALYNWPGELEQLRETIEAAHAACTSHVVAAADLPSILLQAAQTASHVRRKPEPIVLEELLASIEKEAIERTLSETRGNKSEAAALLGMTRPRFYRRLVQLGMIPPESAVEPPAEMPEFIEQEDAEQ
jgi:DNA-binding NtrC family response regulator